MKNQPERLHSLLEELIEGQKKKVLACGQSFIPNLTEDDILQPMDFQELENNPPFRYQEGVLHGMQATYALLLSFSKETGNHDPHL